jgi:hypothetical protein
MVQTEVPTPTLQTKLPSLGSGLTPHAQVGTRPLPFATVGDSAGLAMSPSREYAQTRRGKTSSP